MNRRAAIGLGIAGGIGAAMEGRAGAPSAAWAPNVTQGLNYAGGIEKCATPAADPKWIAWREAKAAFGNKVVSPDAKGRQLQRIRCISDAAREAYFRTHQDKCQSGLASLAERFGFGHHRDAAAGWWEYF